MSARRKPGLDFVVLALGRHVRSVHDRQEKAGNAELTPADLALMVKAGELLLAVECARANLVVRALGRQLASYPPEDLAKLLEQIINSSDDDAETEDAN